MALRQIGLGMVLGLIGLAIAFNSLWLLVTLVPFACHPLRCDRPRGSLSLRMSGPIHSFD
jgi:hypothetical protein